MLFYNTDPLLNYKLHIQPSFLRLRPPWGHWRRLPPEAAASHTSPRGGLPRSVRHLEDAWLRSEGPDLGRLRIQTIETYMKTPHEHRPKGIGRHNHCMLHGSVFVPLLFRTWSKEALLCFEYTSQRLGPWCLISQNREQRISIVWHMFAQVLASALCRQACIRQYWCQMYPQLGPLIQMTISSHYSSVTFVSSPATALQWSIFDAIGCLSFLRDPFSRFPRTFDSIYIIQRIFCSASVAFLGMSMPYVKPYWGAGSSNRQMLMWY